MANVQRRPIILPLLGFACLPVAASAAQLRVIGSGGTVESTVELQSARYDVTQKKVVVTTRAGNVVCNGGQAPASGQVGLQVDGSSFALATDPPGPAQDEPVVVVPAAGGASTYTLSVAGANGGCASSNATAANLKLAFEDGAPLTIAEAVYFDLATRTFDIRVTDPVMCNSYAGGGNSGLSIRLTEATGIAETLGGFDTVTYELAGALLRARSHVQDTGGRLVQCFNFSTPPVAPGASPSGADSIFSARFEYDDVAADLKVSVNPANVAVLAGGPQSFQYTLTIENEGNAPASDVRAREYLPVVPGGAVVAGSWTCERFQGTSNTNLGCGVASGNGVLNQLTAALAPGERLVYTLNRSISGGTAGTNLLLGGAAFVNPSPSSAEGRPERDYTDNSARVAVGMVSNQPPAVPQPLAQTTSEDGTAVVLTYTATDPESDTVQTPTITSSVPGLFTAPLTAQPTGTPNQWSVTLTPAADKNGTATITAAFTDGNSQPVPVTSSVTVTPVNDAPTFVLDVAGAEIVVTQGGTTCGATGSCIASATNFLGSLLPGPATATDEASQVVRPNTAADGFGDQRLVAGACRPAATGGVDPATFFTDGALPRVNEPTPGSFNLLAALSRTVGAVECDITVVDNGVPVATSAPTTLTIRYQTP